VDAGGLSRYVGAEWLEDRVLEERWDSNDLQTILTSLDDLAGYGGSPGYEVSKQDRMAWHELTKEYFLSRRTLAHIFLLIDASTPLAQDDIHAAMW
jgi:GTP-binding protein EngB required for normal cell division